MVSTVSAPICPDIKGNFTEGKFRFYDLNQWNTLLDQVCYHCRIDKMQGEDNTWKYLLADNRKLRPHCNVTSANFGYYCLFMNVYSFSKSHKFSRSLKVAHKFVYTCWYSAKKEWQESIICFLTFHKGYGQLEILHAIKGDLKTEARM